jgi:diaminopimelate decarboxylase
VLSYTRVEIAGRFPSTVKDMGTRKRTQGAKSMKEEINWEPWDEYMDETKGHRKVCAVDLVELAEEYGTPLYVLFEAIIERNYKRYQTLGEKYENHLISYAVKANTAFALIKLLAGYGAGAEVASEYELKFVLDAGVPPEKIRANGNCKSRYFLEECIQRGIVINADPEDELYAINNIAQSLEKKAKANLRLAGFPFKNIAAPNIFTSGKWSKFGTDLERAKNIFCKVRDLNCLDLQGLMVHLGSQIADVNVYSETLGMLIELAKDARNVGLEIREIDLGGGFGISYLGKKEWERTKARIKEDQGFTWRDAPLGYEYDLGSKRLVWEGGELYSPLTPDSCIEALFDGALKQELESIGSPLLILEPGRGIVGNAGLTIFRVCHAGMIPNGQNIVHVDGGANCSYQNIIIPGFLHRIEIINEVGREGSFDAFIAGNLCCTGDLLSRIKTTLKGKPREGDLIAFYDTGAYEDTLSSNANSLPRPAKVMVTKDGEHRLMVRREEYADIFRRDVDWSSRLAQA